ncbi:serine/threonine-protein kinase [Actinomadura gamaensis]|uniref:Serine/threonine-protein kinase n=1 Tax=Actinomadura gamaensis TaxID=1763541 RepID=A0ABV9U8M2_9ACTN
METLRPEDPQVVGRYTLSGRLGSGGMGEVFFGRSPGGRAVAVKLIHPGHAADPEFRRRFRQEVESAQRVGGFHTAPVVDADPDAETPWLVTAYVPGPSLGAAIAAHGPLPPGSLRVLGAGLAEALEAIHAAGVIHRDLKPTNILLADDGPRVIDFGIARAADASAATARVGTPGFMAPEQLVGASITSACDVFAFGMVMAQAAGVRPFGEGPVEALTYRIVHEQPDLSALDPSLRPLITACLSKDPARRPTPPQLLAALADAGGSWPPPNVQTMITERAVPSPSGDPARPPSLGTLPPPQAASTHPAPGAPAGPPVHGAALPAPFAAPRPSIERYPPQVKAAVNRFQAASITLGVFSGWWLLILLVINIYLALILLIPMLVCYVFYLRAAFTLRRRAGWSAGLLTFAACGIIPLVPFAVLPVVLRATRRTVPPAL